MAIRNTAQADPIEKLIVGASPGGIEQQEASGQSELVNSHQLPTDVQGRDVLEKWGIVFGPPNQGDPMFCDATLPNGWTKERTEHSMWSQLVDDKGRVRAMIFYKAAFYDRSAHMRPIRRFEVSRDYGATDKVVFQVKCDGDVLHAESRSFTGDEYQDDWKRAELEAEDACSEWLTANYADYADPVKSWDIVVEV